MRGTRGNMWVSGVVAIALLAALAGCGAAGATGGARSLLGLEPAVHLTVLRPTHVSTMPGASTALSEVRLTTNLAGDGRDQVVVVRRRAGTAGTLTVTHGTTTMLREDDVALAWVMHFGSRHLPVLVTQSASCGSGGCTYAAYTWSRTDRRFAAVTVPAEPAYRYVARRRQFTVLSVPWAGPGLFGFGAPSRTGLALTSRLYDVWQHVMTQQYAYAATGRAGGALIPVGRVTYQPTAAEPSMMALFSTPQMAYVGFLDARGLNLPGQGRALWAGARGRAAWDALKPLGQLGASLSEVSGNPSVVQSGSTARVADWVVGVTGSGEAQTVRAYRVTLGETRLGRVWKVNGATVKRRTLKAGSLKAVLSILHGDRHTLAQLQSGRTFTVVGPIGWTWQLFWANPSGATGSWVSVNAATGVVLPLKE